MEPIPLRGADLIIESTTDSGAIYLGNLKQAKDEKALRKHNIKAVLSVINQGQIFYSEEISNMRCIIEDEQTEDISQYFQKTYQFIQQQRKKSSILIHCYAGISRSATVLIAYLMKKQKIRAGQALQIVQERRTMIQPNRGFLKQLEQYQIRLNLGLNHGKKTPKWMMNSKKQ